MLIKKHVLLKNTAFEAHPGQMIFLKNGLHHFLGEPSGYLHAKFQKNLGCGYRENLVTDERTNERTDGHSLNYRTLFLIYSEGPKSKTRQTDGQTD